MFENIMNFFKKINKKDNKVGANSKDAAKERLHLVLMQDRANVSADFLELMKQEIIEVIKKYIDVDESAIDVRLTNKENSDGTNGAPALYANIPILNIKNESRKIEVKKEVPEKKEENDEDIKETSKVEKQEADQKEDSKKQEVEADKKEEAKEHIEEAEIVIQEVEAEKEEKNEIYEENKTKEEIKSEN